jgi:hypothetical protein
MLSHTILSLFKHVLATLALLQTHMNFRIRVLMCKRNLCKKKKSLDSTKFMNQRTDVLAIFDFPIINMLHLSNY